MIIGVIALLAIAAVFIWANSNARSTKRLAEKQAQAPTALNDGESQVGNMEDQSDKQAGKWSTFKKPEDGKLKEMLSPMQYKVTQKDGTEASYQNEYWDNKKEGIYVDVVSGEPLFSSTNKYKSGTGWPSFTKPLEPALVETKVDYGLVYPRTEVRSKYANSHLGHVFDDGPTTMEQSGGAAPTGLRYCLNSAALKFISKEELEEKGYGEYKTLFEKK